MNPDPLLATYPFIDSTHNSTASQYEGQSQQKHRLPHSPESTAMFTTAGNAFSTASAMKFLDSTLFFPGRASNSASSSKNTAKEPKSVNHPTEDVLETPTPSPHLVCHSRSPLPARVRRQRQRTRLTRSPLPTSEGLRSIGCSSDAARRRAVLREPRHAKSSATYSAVPTLTFTHHFACDNN
jgi:hypothetical protein